ncbi:MAG: hypothetical protein RIC89_13485, partial [Pseudomonadales bacterium]
GVSGLIANLVGRSNNNMGRALSTVVLDGVAFIVMAWGFCLFHFDIVTALSSLEYIFMILDPFMWSTSPVNAFT